MTQEFTAVQTQDLALRTVELLKVVHKPRIVILFAGVPGAGKSTISSQVVEILNTQFYVKSTILPQDGYHYYRHQLAAMADPEEAFERRGAPFTFDATAFLKTVSQLQNNTTVTAPSFDHRLKDPVENDIEISSDTQVVFVEGNYVLLKDEPWCNLSQYADETWMVTADVELIQERIVKRHLESGICANMEEAVARASGSDFKNATHVRQNSIVPDVLIHN